jgi:hypothetical protein
VLEESRTNTGGFAYFDFNSGDKNKFRNKEATVPGSVGRSAVCETTLTLLGSGKGEKIQTTVDAFHQHWSELEARRQKTGTHAGPHWIAPYYFFFAHRYVAQAIQMLPEKARDAEREKLLKLVLKVRDSDGTWNDRSVRKARSYGTAMVVLILLNERTPLPAALN